VALNARITGRYDGVAKFVLTGEGAIILDGDGARADNDSGDGSGDDAADVTLTAEPEVFQDIISGDLNPTSAFMQGKLTVDGDMSKAMGLASVLA
jgi:putative sterol carrier protein